MIFCTTRRNCFANFVKMEDSTTLLRRFSLQKQYRYLQEVKIFNDNLHDTFLIYGLNHEIKSTFVAVDYHITTRFVCGICELRGCRDYSISNSRIIQHLRNISELSSLAIEYLNLTAF